MMSPSDKVAPVELAKEKKKKIQFLPLGRNQVKTKDL